ncbi:RuBisCO large subunit C-terminal-like domain-containing protein [Sorangium sp. So ce291]|uniref:RuBisCO large subunit C-terminal-like domain-containing protein n=1 Tax=Sorangium sp. So ce291 TaxID=3133294 RepID=UPI003F5F1ED6
MKSSSSYLKHVDLDFAPDPEAHVIASYQAKRSDKSRLEGLAFLGSVAAESSTGTWIDVATSTQAANRVAGKVFSFAPETGLAQIAYPLALFEPGNVSQLLTVVAGNAFGLADLERLKLMDVRLPQAYVRGYRGPKFGLEGIQQKLGITTPRPIIGAIIKPKCGLSAEEHAAVCHDAWVGMSDEAGVDGVDMVKDDEALASQPAFGSDFYRRVDVVLGRMKAAQDKTGRKKIYVPNVTSSNVFESIRRAEYVRERGGDAVMIDYVISGCALLHTLREQDLGLVIHGHRTLFAALHRAGDFGVDYMVWAKLFRMIGGDQVHTGTPALGVMSASSPAVQSVCSAVRDDLFAPSDPRSGHLEQPFSGVRPVAPICGAGLDPLTTEPLARALGPSVIIFAGGGVHGHPGGTRAGAASMRESVNALSNGMSLAAWAEQRRAPWLDEAVRFFSRFDKQSPNAQAREAM